MTTAAPTRLSVSPAERLQLARATASFQALIAWDHAWTGAAQTEQPLADGGERLLPIMAAELQRGLGEAYQGAIWLHDYVTNNFEPLSSAIADQAGVARGQELPEFADLLEEFGPQLRDLAVDGYEGFTDAEAEEQRSLSEKLTELLQGGSGSDLSLKIRCNLADLTIVAGLVTAVIPPHAHAVGIIGAGNLARATWKCSKQNQHAKPASSGSDSEHIDL